MKKIYLLIFVFFIFLSTFGIFYYKKTTKLEDDKVITSQDKETLQYKNIARGFTFEYPKELSYKETDEGDTTHTIVFTDNIGEKSFQIFLTPYYGNQITSSRIIKDIPSGKYTTPIDIVINGNIRALAFFSILDIGEMREIWFLHDGYLYQVTTYKELDGWLAKIMETWEFYQISSVRNI